MPSVPVPAVGSVESCRTAVQRDLAFENLLPAQASSRLVLPPRDGLDDLWYIVLRPLNIPPGSIQRIESPNVRQAMQGNRSSHIFSYFDGLENNIPGYDAQSYSFPILLHVLSKHPASN